MSIKELRALTIHYLIIIIIIIIIIIQLLTAVFKAYCAIWVRRSNFRHQASPRVPPRESTQRRKVELCARNVR
jgi:heme/copper-type cytochrome/quinol oxidase subunit 2